MGKRIVLHAEGCVRSKKVDEFEELQGAVVWLEQNMLEELEAGVSGGRDLNPGSVLGLKAV